jgi:TrmH family RNA methyltransferase
VAISDQERLARLVVSPENARVKRLRRASRSSSFRVDENLVILEGRKVLFDIVAGDVELECVFIDETALDSELSQLARSCEQRGIWVGVVDSKLVNEVSELKTPSGVLGLAKRPSGDFEEILACQVVLALDGVQDPGNVGTLIRSARSVGGVGVICGLGTADPFSPKSLRASAGTVMSTKVCSVSDLSSALQSARDDGGFELVGLDAGAPSSLWDQHFSDKVVLLVGSEGRGIAQEQRTILDRMVSIPIDAGVESLNVAISGSIALFELQRQRYRVL